MKQRYQRLIRISKYDLKGIFNADDFLVCSINACQIKLIILKFKNTLEERIAK